MFHVEPGEFEMSFEFDSVSHAKNSLQNSKRVLGMQEVIYQNGKSSHDVHWEVYCSAVDYLQRQPEIEIHSWVVANM
jgi:hypothetical protein